MAAIVLDDPDSPPPSDQPDKEKSAPNFTQILEPQPATVNETPQYHTDQGPQVSVAEGAPINSCLGFNMQSINPQTGAQQLPPCPHFTSQAPSVSWADLLKHKGEAFVNVFEELVLIFLY